MNELALHQPINELALFAGAGGGLLGSKLLGWKTVCAVELDAYCREILLRRQRDGVLDVFPIWDDVRTFDGRAWRGLVDVVTAGFPCAPFSCAGKRRGAADDRNLWPETIRVVREVGPRWCLLENVPALVSCGYLATVLGDLAESGFDAEWDVLSAAGVGAPHLRRRLWIVGHANGDGEPALPVDAEVAELPAMAHAERSRLEEQPCRPGDAREEQSAAERGGGAGGWWEIEPDVVRVADGVAFGLDRT